MSIIDYNLEPAPPLDPTKFNQQDRNCKWEYFEDDEYLLRFCLFSEKNIFIRFEVLNTSILSNNNEMFAENFKTKDLVEELNINKDFDTYTFLNVLFENRSPKGSFNKNNEFILLINKNEKEKFKLALKSTKCNDQEFLKKNISKKFEQIKKKIKEYCKELEDENKNLIKANEELEKELKEIDEINDLLCSKNDEISRSLNGLLENQDEAIKHLQKIKE